ncbi:MAG: hypothetical protein N2Z64_01935 [Dictyoglomus thermophilum]|nr:hypothetical protein [Dictyoglomus thermophilum]
MEKIKEKGYSLNSFYLLIFIIIPIFLILVPISIPMWFFYLIFIERINILSYTIGYKNR